MTKNINAEVARIMNNALAASRPGVLLQQAAAATAPKAGCKVPRIKLNREEVHAVMRVVTEQLRRFGLKPTVALLPPEAPKDAAGNTYKLFLTEDC